MNLTSAFDKAWKSFFLILGIWVIVGTLFSVQSYLYRLHVGREVTWWGLYPMELLFFISCGVFTPLMIRSARRFRVERKNWLPRIGIQLGIAIAAALAHRFLYELINQNLNATVERPFSWDVLFRNVIGFSDYGFFMYFIVVFVVHAVDYNKQLIGEQVTTAQLKEQLVSAQLDALRMQLQPHFLFNTLNTISVLIREDPLKAEKMVGVLSDLLRFTLHHSNKPELSLREEIDFLKLYLHIEQARFGDRLNVSFQIADSTTEAQVPTLILQPLVENAIKHGIAKHRGEGRIVISSTLEHSALKVSIADNGSGILQNESSPSQAGIGLANCKSRLKTLYGDNASIQLTNVEERGTLVEILLPFKVVQ